MSIVKKKKITVKVTQKHIDNAEPMNGESCPIALALKAQRYTNVNVGGENGTWISSRTGANDYELHLPKSALNFIDKFDGEGNVKPFTFTAVREHILKDEEYLLD